MKIIVTGGTGFVGSALSRRLLSLGHTVYVTGRESPPAGTVHLCQDFQWCDCPPNLDALVHLAAITDAQHPDEWKCLLVNALNAGAMFQRVGAVGCRRVVYASSAAVYGDQPAPQSEDTPARPLTPYARSKFDLEGIAKGFQRETEIPTLGLRFSNIWGTPEQEATKGRNASYLSQMVSQARTTGEVTLFEGTEDSRRDWLFVEDCVNALVRAIQRPDVTGVLNLGSGESHSFREVVTKVGQELQKDVRIKTIANPHAGRYQHHTELDIRRVQASLDWEPTEWSRLVLSRGSVRGSHSSASVRTVQEVQFRD